ncbi:MAG: hypothetical protein ACREND_16220, partial [Gemmatimonadaceae bacterium]
MGDMPFVSRPGTICNLRRATGVALALLVGGSVASVAQESAFTGIRPRSLPNGSQCRDTLVAANVARFTALQLAVSRDTTAAIVAQLDLVGQRIAEAARTSLGATGQAVPAADSLGMFLNSYTRIPIDIVLRRSGSWTWRLVPPDSNQAPAKVTALYARALQSIPADSMWIVWPDGYAPDSVVLRLELMSYRNMIQFSGRATSAAFAVFTTKGISWTPAFVRRRPPAGYPPDAVRKRFGANVLLQFMIDD